jgi:hypothetical protein
MSFDKDQQVLDEHVRRPFRECDWQHLRWAIVLVLGHQLVLRR